MLYKKPPNMRYTQLCMYVDEHIRDDDEKAKETCFEYLWNIFYILAVKGKMFNSGRDYDEYALYAATQLFIRYQKESNPDSKLKPIKSCLNYIKKVLYPMKVNYQRANFEQVFTPITSLNYKDMPIYEHKVTEIRSINNVLLQVECKQYLSQLHNTIMAYLKETPYRNDKKTLHALYMSCILSILKSITMSNKNKAKLKKREDKNYSTVDLVDSIYAEEREDNVVIFHLDKSMKNYIETLVNGIKKEITKDLRYIIGSYEPSDQVIKDLLISPIEEVVNRV